MGYLYAIFCTTVVTITLILNILGAKFILINANNHEEVEKLIQEYEIGVNDD